MMMRRTILIMTVFAGLVCGQCRAPKTTGMVDGVMIIDPDKIDKKMIMASALIDSVVYIPLQSADTMLIGKIERMEVWKDHYYLWDRIGESVYIYHISGKLLHKISRQGRGEGEYPRCTGFAVDKSNGHVYIASDVLQSILEYDEQGNYVRSISCPFVLSDFVFTGQDSLLWYGGSDYNQIYFKDIAPDQYRLVFRENGIDKKRHLKFTYDMVFGQWVSHSKNLYYFQDTLYLVEDIVNDVYEVSAGGDLKLRYKIDFGDKNIPVNYTSLPSEIREVSEILWKDGKKWCTLGQVLENERIIYIEYGYRDLLYHAIYSKKYNRVYNIGPVWLNDIDKLGMPRICNTGVEGNVLIGYLEAHLLKELAQAPKCSVKMKKMAAELTDQDNPVLVKLYFKDI